uniref:Interleukin-27 subunit alpha-like n=1 Tax=Scleropages formosus TaxID=113540 RepID=A0A8C9QWG7_SCLFO
CYYTAQRRSSLSFLSRMTSTYRVLFAILLLPLCSPFPSHQQRPPSFSNSLSFTRKIRTRVQNLLLQYNGQQLGDEQFEDRDLALHTLPSISMNYTHWLQMQDWERLSQASRDLQTFWAHLDIKCQQLEAERQNQGGAPGVGLQGQPAPTLAQSMLRVQMDLRDLIQQVDTQVHAVIQVTSDTSSIPDPNLEINLDPASSQLWSSRLQGYVILRDLSRYLGKLARDFTLLASTQRS